VKTKSLTLSTLGLLLALSGCRKEDSAPLPTGHFEGPMSVMRYKTTGEIPETGATASLDVANDGTLLFRYFGMECTGAAARVNEQLVANGLACREPYMPDCAVTPGQLSFGIAGDTLEMRTFAYAYADSPACQLNAAERVEFEPAALASVPAAPTP
jgi:hypothetical protein